MVCLGFEPKPQDGRRNETTEPFFISFPGFAGPPLRKRILESLVNYLFCFTIKELFSILMASLLNIK